MNGSKVKSEGNQNQKESRSMLLLKTGQVVMNFMHILQVVFKLQWYSPDMKTPEKRRELSHYY